MLAEARRAAEERGVIERLTLQQADSLAVPTLFAEPIFDVALCHNVVQYVDDAAALVQAICHPLKPGGVLSLMSVNRYSEFYRQALRELDLEEARNSLDTGTFVTVVFGVPAHRYTAEDLIRLLLPAGSELLAQYGVRCVCDYIIDNEIKSDPEFYAQLEQLEIAVSDRFPYYLFGRFFQIIARKSSRPGMQA